ncbi:MAG: MATE family efflux transporter, partial [Oscillospiraceae bacterium]|nr:MATE family efflux transporter [Oscillospiraceae bacterium]
MFDNLRNDRELWRQFINISLPIAGQNLILFAVSMADTVMVGRLGEVQLSAVQLANQPGFFLNMIMFGVSGGANVMIAQYWGKRDVESIRRVMAIMYRIVAA